jgi:hypothetical protein
MLLALSLLFLAGVVVAPVQAQNQKAYAPEDLRRLSVQDQIRVLEREYSEQSRGRQLPDDQLDFYLDQVDSGWSFSRIKQDIAESLRGSAWAPPSSGWQQREVICSSINDRRNECRTPFQGPAVLSQQISQSACIEGRTWGQNRGRLWVDEGCRGRFREDDRWGGGGYPGGASQQGSITCESREGRLRRCPNDFRNEVDLIEQFSNAPCIRGQTWDARPGEVTVTRGCRARFAEVRGRPGGGRPIGGNQQGGYSVTCSSEDDRLRTCTWSNRGRPVLIEQLSRSSCVEGRTWGYDQRGLWVDRGCRARFGVR